MNLVKNDDDEAQQAFLPKPAEDLENNHQEAKSTSKWYWRFALEILMAAIIAVLTTRILLDKATVKPSPVPNCT